MTRISPILLVFLPLAVGVLLAAGHHSVDLPRDQSDLFSASGNCASCHVPDNDNPTALRDASGNDVSPPSYWRSTMMANAAKDPLWKAKVSAEVADNPSLQAAIEDKCTTCHAPMGRTEAVAEGASGYSIAEMEGDPLALDGVSCTVCHQIKPDNLGLDESFSGGFEIGHDQTIYGPYTEPFGWPMLAMSGFEPVFGEHMNSSALCATCHTLFTDAVDEQGNVVGRIAEQAPYLEWLNSDYPAMELECQSCHMPTESVPVPISNTPRGLDAREPFYRHEFVGGNAYMLTMLRDNAVELGVTAEPVHFDSTIARTRRNLARSASIEAEANWDGDTLDVSLLIANWSGHKLPTGYPARRVWVEFEVRDASGALAFSSGGWDPATGRLEAGETFQPHHETIRSSSQVQVYESVMGDKDGSETFGLLRATEYLKDNRLPPTGWMDSGPRSEDTAIRGAAERDPSFNHSTDGVEGSGTDEVRYRIGLARSDYSVSARLLYQSIKPAFADDLLGHSTDDVDRFRDMYEALPNRPEIISEAELNIGPSALATGDGPEARHPEIQVYPNPVSLGETLHLGAATASPNDTYVIYDLLGREVIRLAEPQWTVGAGSTSLSAGVYVIVGPNGQTGTVVVRR